MKQKYLFLSLKNKQDITKVFDFGEKIYSKNILVRCLSTDPLQESLPLYVLMALPKKKLGAVGRNRLRRICKSALRQALNNLIRTQNVVSTGSYNIVIHARENLNEISEPERVREFESVISRLFQRGEK